MTHTYAWRHGWVPLTMRAALQKAHGNHDQAARLLDQARADRGRRRQRPAPAFVPPSPAHQRAHAERQRAAAWSTFTDDQLATAMGGTEDAAVLDQLVAELDRRDRAERQRARDTARRQARRRERDETRERDFDAACAAGEDPAAAYARVYGVTEERQRRAEATSALERQGYAGRDFRTRCRSAFHDYADESYAAAEDECRGQLLSKAGQAAGVHPRQLFRGPESRARKYASEELRGYWERVGRMTFEDFQASLLGGSMRSAGAAAWA